MCRSLAIGRLLLELAAPAIEDDFVGLLGDHVALARHALPFLVIGAHVGREFRLSHVDHVSAHPAVALAYRPAGQRFAKRSTQFVYYPGWSVGRDKNSSKRARLIPLDAELI